MSLPSGVHAEVLLVDPDREHNQNIQEGLSRQGYRVRLAASGQAGFDILQTGTVDVVLCGLSLPDIPGADWLEKARLIQPSVQVVMMSHDPDVDTIREALRRQASDFLNKPVVHNALLRSIHNALKVKQVDDERRNLLVVLARKNAEVEEQAEIRSALLQLLRHDLANLISGAAAALVRKKLSIEEYRKTEDMVLQMLQQGESVIEEVRERSKGKKAAPMEREGVSNLKHLIGLSLNTLETQAEAKRVTLQTNAPSDIDVRVRPGPFVLHVLNNLVSNAIKFSFPNSSVTLSAHVSDEWVVLTVRDSGCGIAPDRIKTLFDHPQSTPGTMGERGTGYGLRHAKLFLQDIGGSLNVTSTPNQSGQANDACGTCFTVHIRRYCTSAALDEGAYSESPGETVDLSGGLPGLLIIDDAWPVTDGLCLALLDLFASRPECTYRVDYLRVPPALRSLQQNSEAKHVSFRALIDTFGGDREAALNAAFSGHNTKEFRVLLLQDKASIKRFYSCLADPLFMRRLKRTFRVLAVDYALGIPVTGTEILSTIGNAAQRILISANAAEHLPADYRDCCDVRIQKSSVRLPTLAERLMDAVLHESASSAASGDDHAVAH